MAVDTQVSQSFVGVVSKYVAPPPVMRVSQSHLSVVSKYVSPPPVMRVSQSMLSALSKYTQPAPVMRVSQSHISVLSAYVADPDAPSSGQQQADVIIPIDRTITISGLDGSAKSQPNPAANAYAQPFAKDIIFGGLDGHPGGSNGAGMNVALAPIKISPVTGYASGKGFKYQTDFPPISISAFSAAARDGTGKVSAPIDVTIKLTPFQPQAPVAEFSPFRINAATVRAFSGAFVGDTDPFPVVHFGGLDGQGFDSPYVLATGDLASVTAVGAEAEGSASAAFTSRADDFEPVQLVGAEAAVIHGSSITVALPSGIAIKAAKGGMSRPKSAQVLAPLATIKVGFTGKTSPAGEYFYTVGREFPEIEIANAVQGGAVSLSSGTVFLVTREARTGFVDGIIGVLISLDADAFSTDARVIAEATRFLKQYKPEVPRNYFSAVQRVCSSDGGDMSREHSALIVQEIAYAKRGLDADAVFTH